MGTVGEERGRTGPGILTGMDAIDRIAQVALVLGPDGRIAQVNEAWRVLGRGRGLATPAAWLGVSYPDLCRTATGRWVEGALDAAVAIDAVLAGELDSAEVGYACDGLDDPADQAWFTLVVRALPDPGGALLLHLTTPDPRFLTPSDRRFMDLAWRHLIGFETRCAWCTRMVEPDATWTLRPPIAGAPVSDGVCPTCEAGLMAELRALEAGILTAG